MKHVSTKDLRIEWASSVLLVAITLSPLFWPSQANADIFDLLKKTAEEVVQEELNKALGNEPGQQQGTPSQPDATVQEV